MLGFMGIGRRNIPSIMVTGGVMEAGPDMLTLEEIGKYSAMRSQRARSPGSSSYFTPCMSQLRSLQLYGHSLHHAGHGAEAWAPFMLPGTMRSAGQSARISKEGGSRYGPAGHEGWRKWI